jgi:hypothetical protein
MNSARVPEEGGQVELIAAIDGRRGIGQHGQHAVGVVAVSWSRTASCARATLVRLTGQADCKKDEISVWSAEGIVSYYTVLPRPAPPYVTKNCDGLEGARREVEAAGGKALVLPTDVADAEQV